MIGYRGIVTTRRSVTTIVVSFHEADTTPFLGADSNEQRGVLVRSWLASFMGLSRWTRDRLWLRRPDGDDPCLTIMDSRQTPRMEPGVGG